MKCDIAVIFRSNVISGNSYFSLACVLPARVVVKQNQPQVYIVDLFKRNMGSDIFCWFCKVYIADKCMVNVNAR